MNALPCRFLLLASVIAAVGGCGEPPKARFAAMDQPQAEPSRVEGPAPKPVEDRTGVDEQAVANCSRGTGRLPDGTCERMRLRMKDHVQQVQVPGGRFVMGHPPNRYDASPAMETPKIQWAEQPPRHADVGSFWIDLYEVSREEYAKCVKAGKCTRAACPDGANPVGHVEANIASKLPQTCVSAEQATAFCKAAGSRLPTETEWEYAARGPDARPFPWGGAIRDEYHAELVPVGGLAGDVSYFGLRGMGTNAREWTSSRFDPDLPLAQFVQNFRAADGPLLAARRGREAGNVIKGGRTSFRREATGPETKVGFRCAGDVDPNETPMTVPDEAPPVPLVHTSPEMLQVFGGVAEAVNQAEATAFCDGVSVGWKDQTADNWELPTLADIRKIRDSFAGPGPFWTVEGAAAQRGTGQRPIPTDPWVLLDDVTPDAALAARCIRRPPPQKPTP